MAAKSKLRILVAHNRYRYLGGEDSVMHAEVEMLRSAQHPVALLQADNREIDGTLAKIAAAGSLFHSASSNRKFAELLQTFQPDILHIHNWLPQLSPSIIGMAASAGVPVVQTLHNFRMLCANGILYRNGRVCRDCIGKRFPLAPALHGCYASSRVGSALVSAAFAYHRVANTWQGVSSFIALSEFQRSLLIAGGIPPARIVIKPNFIRAAGGPGDGRGGYALFAGRLTPEKGIRTALDAWERNQISIPLRIMGDGPLLAEVRERAARHPQIDYLGQRSPAFVSAAMAEARFLLFPSEWYEPFALTVVEAFSRGTPVLAANLESISELVRPGLTGLHFKPGDAADLSAKASLLVADTPAYLRMRECCRSTYEQRYTAPINYQLLMSIYQRASTSARAQTLGNEAQQLEQVHS